MGTTKALVSSPCTNTMASKQTVTAAVESDALPTVIDLSIDTHTHTKPHRALQPCGSRRP